MCPVRSVTYVSGRSLTEDDLVQLVPTLIEMPSSEAEYS